MSKKMVEIAEAIRTKFAQYEAVPGSGYHDTDRNLTRESIFRAPQKNGFCKASENLVNFSGDYEVVFVGSDAPKALELLQRWSSSPILAPEGDNTGPGIVGVKEQKMKRAISKLKIIQVDGVDRLILRRPLWNDYMEIFYSLGQGLSGQPFTEEE